MCITIYSTIFELMITRFVVYCSATELQHLHDKLKINTLHIKIIKNIYKIYTKQRHLREKLNTKPIQQLLVF